MKKYLASTDYLNWENEAVSSRAHELISGVDSPADKSVRLFNFVRDTVPYNPYVNFLDRAIYPASVTLAAESAFCVPKAILLAAMARAAGIPSRLGFAHIKNYLMPEKFKETIKTDIIFGHGFAELFLNESWIKLTPAFDSEMSKKNGYQVVEFNGRDDALFPEYDLSGEKHIEYREYEESFDDFPYEWYIETVHEKYQDNPAFSGIIELLQKGMDPAGNKIS